MRANGEAFPNQSNILSYTYTQPKWMPIHHLESVTSQCAVDRLSQCYKNKLNSFSSRSSVPDPARSLLHSSGSPESAGDRIPSPDRSTPSAFNASNFQHTSIACLGDTGKHPETTHILDILTLLWPLNFWTQSHGSISVLHGYHHV